MAKSENSTQDVQEPVFQVGDRVVWNETGGIGIVESVNMVYPDYMAPYQRIGVTYNPAVQVPERGGITYVTFTEGASRFYTLAQER